LTTVWSIGWVVPVNRTVSTSPRGFIVWTSCGISSSGRVVATDLEVTWDAGARVAFQAKAPLASTPATPTAAIRNLLLAFMTVDP
jgi:hypothetical protein